MSIATPSSTRGPTSSPRSPDMIRTKKTLHLRPHRSIIEEGALAPLHHRFRIKIVAAGELLDRSLRSLYSSSDGVRGLGAAVKNLSHRPSCRFWLASPCHTLSAGRRTAPQRWLSPTASSESMLRALTCIPNRHDSHRLLFRGEKAGAVDGPLRPNCFLGGSSLACRRATHFPPRRLGAGC